jgi:O-antigen/teichoic acid export membrane protein
VPVRLPVTMHIGTGELILLIILLLVVGLVVVAPIVGIRSAERRMREQRRAMRPVVLATLNVAWMLAAGIAIIARDRLFPAVPLVGIGLSSAWLLGAVRANRSRVRPDRGR